MKRLTYEQVKSIYYCVLEMNENIILINGWPILITNPDKLQYRIKENGCHIFIGKGQ